MKLLVGYDGSDCAEAALEDLKRAGLPVSGEVQVVSVAEEWPAYTLAGFDAMEREEPSYEETSGQAHSYDTQYDRWAQAAVETSRRGAERLRTLLPEWTVTTSVYRSSPYSALLQVADDWKADMILLGSHGRSALGRALFGSVSHFVVNHARCSVRIARAPLFASDAPERILIALDGSEDSLNAVDEVARRRWPRGTQARVVTALDHRFLSLVPDYDFPAMHYEEAVDTEMRKQVEVSAARACARLTSAGIEAKSFLRDGDPKRVLLEEAEQWQADCIFAGAKGHSALERFLVGSVSASIALTARCSVEIVRPRASAVTQ